MEKDKVLEVEVGGIISFTVFQDGKLVALLYASDQIALE